MFNTVEFVLYQLTNDLERRLLIVSVKRFHESWISDACRRKWTWAINVFEEWRNLRNALVVREKTGGEPVQTKSLDAMSEQELDFFLAQFIAEVRKQDREEYPGKTIYEMISSIQGYLRKVCKQDLYLIDKKGSRFST